MGFNSTHHTHGAYHHAIHYWHQGSALTVVTFSEKRKERE